MSAADDCINVAFARFLQSVLSAAEQYDAIMRDSTLDSAERQARVADITVDGATFDQLALTMTHVGAHNDADVAVQPLCDNGENIEVGIRLWLIPDSYA